MRVERIPQKDARDKPKYLVYPDPLTVTVIDSDSDEDEDGEIECTCDYYDCSHVKAVRLQVKIEKLQ